MAFGVVLYTLPTTDLKSEAFLTKARDWVKRTLELPGVVSFMGYRSAGDGLTLMNMVEFKSIEDATLAAASDEVKVLLEEIRSLGATPTVMTMERSPFTPEPLRA